MFQSHVVMSEEDQQRFCDVAAPAPLTPEVIARQRPDLSWMLADRAGTVAARCSLWWTEVPAMAGERLGLIGHYAAHDADAANQMLELSCCYLADQGCTLAVGPMDGNTWQRYRLLTERGSEPAFFLEPDNPDAWPGHFTGNGFTPLAQYCSALNADLDRADQRTTEIAGRVQERGITLRPLRLERFEEELRSIHALSLASFERNFLYTPIAEEDFLAQYRGIKSYVRPEMVLLAEQAGQIIGFIFAIPDLLQAKRGQAIDTAIIKTMAVHPAHAGAGLGGLLMAKCQEAVRALGYRRAIHALFHEQNKSAKISSHTAKVIRRYTLFSKRLQAVP